MLALMLENQPGSPFANLRQITCRMSSHNSSSFSQKGAAGKAGAVQDCLRMQAMWHRYGSDLPGSVCSSQI